MKTIVVIIACVGMLLSGCTYRCDNNSRPHCLDAMPPASGGYPCNTQYERWFYIPSTNSCEKRVYWGCYAGFGSEEACEDCKCND